MNLQNNTFQIFNTFDVYISQKRGFQMIPKNNKKQQQKKQYNNEQLFMQLNIYLSCILQTISQMKIAFQPCFLCALALIIRAKIVVCTESNWKTCFCTGCMLARRINGVLQQQQWLQQQMTKISERIKKKQIKQMMSNPLQMWKLKNKGSSQNEKIELSMKQQQILQEYVEENLDKWVKQNDEIVRFVPIFYLASNLKDFCLTNKFNILGFLKNCVHVGYNNKHSMHLYEQLKNLKTSSKTS